jgi:hypothetical protein
MKTFNDLQFKEHPKGAVYGGIISRIIFDNGYGATVVQGPHSYGGSDGLYELAVVGKDDEICYDTPVTGDVEGYLSETQVTDLLIKIQQL